MRKPIIAILLGISLLLISDPLSKFLERGGEIGRQLAYLILALYLILSALIVILTVVERGEPGEGFGEADLGDPL